jgi:hypothetical protein
MNSMMRRPPRPPWMQHSGGTFYPLEQHVSKIADLLAGTRQDVARFLKQDYCDHR